MRRLDLLRPTRRLLTLLVALATLAAAAEPKKARNLVPNGGLEKGSGRTPANWAPFDGITQLWQRNGGAPGKCLTLNTNVLQIDKKQFIEDEKNFKAGKNKGGQYDVVGAHEGAWAFAAPIDLRPDDSWFILSADVYAEHKSSELFYPQILIRGFQPVTETSPADGAVWFHDHFRNGQGYEDTFGSKDLIRKPRKGDWRQVYRHAMACRISVPHKWRKFELGFKLPTIKRFRPTRLLLKCYAIWPAGKYSFDNIALRRATAEEAKAANDRRPSIHEVVPE